MTTGVGGIGGALVGLPGVVLAQALAAAPVERCQRLGDIVDRYGVRPALSGLLCDSVDMVSGNKLCLPADEMDFRLSGRLPLGWSRFYSSALGRSALFGTGWRISWEMTLRKAGDQLIYTDELGNTLSVPFPSLGSQAIVTSAQLHVAHLPDGRLVVADLAPLYRVFGDFDADGVARLKYVEDLHGQRIGCIWDAGGRLLRMRGTCGHELRMHYDARSGSRLSGIECVDGGPAGMLVQYGYNQNGELTEVRNRLGDTVRRFAWSDGRMVEEASALGMTTRYVWQKIDGVARVVERVTSEGARERFTYRIENRTSQVTDVFGNTATWQYDERGHVVSHTGFDGRRYGFGYGGAAAPGTLTLPGERVVRLAFDTLGRVVEEIDPLGRVRTTQYAFATREPVVVLMSDGRRWMWRRNDSLQPVHYQPPSGAITRIEYDANGLAARCTDAQGLVTVFEHNARGQLTRRIAADAGVTLYERDVNGHVIQFTDALGTVTRIERDDLGRPLTVIRPDGRHERHVWNTAGQRVSFVGANGQSRHWHRNRRGKVVRTVDEEGHVVVYEYDAHGRPQRIESANGAVQVLEWGAAGCRSIADADGVIRRFDYTDAGQIRRVTTKAGSLERHESFSYDAGGHLLQRDTLLNHYVYRYSARGLLEAAIRTPTQEGELLGIGADEIRFEYDAGGRLLAEHGANGQLHLSRDASGRIVAITLPQGHVVRTRRYANETGDIAQVEFDELEIARFWYDAVHREVARTQGVLNTHTGYSPLGRPVWWRSVVGNEPSGVASPSERGMQLWREVDYGPSDAVVRTGGPTDDQTYYDYDRRGCLLRRVSAQQDIEYFTWDAAGNLLDSPVGSWLPAIYADHRIRECRGYSYEYDAWGQLVRRSGRGHVISFEWSAEGHLIAARLKGRTVRYQYDVLGRRIAKVVEQAATNGPPTQVRDDVTHYLWHGHRLLQERRPGWLRTYLYQPGPDDSAGYAPLACVDQSLTDTGEIRDTQVYHYHTDTAGTAMALTDATGKLAWRSRYRAWGHSVAQEWGESSGVLQPLRYAGQYLDAETGFHHNGARIYDPDAGRYISPDRTAPGGVSPYRYAPNPLVWCNPSGRAVPVRLPRVAAAASDLDFLADPAQHVAGVVGQFDDVPGWNPFEAGLEDHVKV